MKLQLLINRFWPPFGLVDEEPPPTSQGTFEQGWLLVKGEAASCYNTYLEAFFVTSFQNDYPPNSVMERDRQLCFFCGSAVVGFYLKLLGPGYCLWHSEMKLLLIKSVGAVSNRPCWSTGLGANLFMSSWGVLPTHYGQGQASQLASMDDWPLALKMTGRVSRKRTNLNRLRTWAHQAFFMVHVNDLCHHTFYWVSHVAAVFGQPRCVCCDFRRCPIIASRSNRLRNLS